MDFDNKNIWTIKGATLSDKSVKDEYGLTQDEIVLAINTGKFQYRINYIFENPQINKNLRTIKNQTKTLEKRKNELQIHLNNLEMQSNSKSKV